MERLNGLNNRNQIRRQNQRQQQLEYRQRYREERDNHRNIENIENAPLNGLGNGNNEVPDEHPAFRNISQQIKSFKQQIYSVLICSATDRQYALLGTYDENITLQMINMAVEIQSLLKHKNNGGNFRSLAWKDLLPEVRAAIGNPRNGQSLVVPFTHEYVIKNMDFIFVSNFKVDA